MTGLHHLLTPAFMCLEGGAATVDVLARAERAVERARWNPCGTAAEALWLPGYPKFECVIFHEWWVGGQPEPPARYPGQTARQYRASRRGYGRELRAWRRDGCPAPTVGRIIAIRGWGRSFDGRLKFGHMQAVPEELFDEPLIVQLVVRHIQGLLNEAARAYALEQLRQPA